MRKSVTVVLMMWTMLDALQVAAQHSVVRRWNEVLIQAIRNDLARPTVAARNLFHTSAAMYDAWAVYDATATPYFLGQEVGGFAIPYEPIQMQGSIKAAREKAISHAAYRMIESRFQFSPRYSKTMALADSLMQVLGYNAQNTSIDYASLDPAAMGNYIAYQILRFGLQDGSNETGFYDSKFYKPVNPPLSPKNIGNRDFPFPNRWQPLGFDKFVDQSGNVTFNSVPKFQAPEWGNVIPFAMGPAERTPKTRDGIDFLVYHDGIGELPLLVPGDAQKSAEYIWNHSFVAIWSSHLSPDDQVMWDISPAGFGNIDFTSFPTTLSGLHDFYHLTEGGDIGTGRRVNPVTGKPYTPQIVPRGDFTRVIAEFWADGPTSETPPGHWFTLLNYVMDQPLFERKLFGTEAQLDSIEYEVKAYFTLGGALHDAAISAWSLKGYYDYVRPISAIRYMARKGQSTNPSGVRYSTEGLPVIPGYIEQIASGDPLAGELDVFVGTMKIRAWRGPDAIPDPASTVAGVGWIRGEEWWPYQRPTFVTPPFAGFVSGHSTYSRTAAEVLTQLTGSPYFPGGLGEFKAKKNQYLVFEDGPSVDVTLQWATYYDASNQSSLSRIWGGIHPPSDDIPGRRIGDQVARTAVKFAKRYFEGIITGLDNDPNDMGVANPVTTFQQVKLPVGVSRARLFDMQGRPLAEASADQFLDMPAWPGMYLLRLEHDGHVYCQKIIVR